MPASSLEPTTMGHLPTVLTEHSSAGNTSQAGDYGGMFAKSSPPHELDGLLGGGTQAMAVPHPHSHHRYPPEPVATYSSTSAPGLNCGGTTYHHGTGTWGAQATPSVSNFHAHHHAQHNYPNYYGGNTGAPSAAPPPGVAQASSYLNPAPTMVLYPHLYSTVNQNQIHLHLHSGGAEPSSKTESLQYQPPPAQQEEVAHQDEHQPPSSSEVAISRYQDNRQQTDPNVWRPY